MGDVLPFQDRGKRGRRRSPAVRNGVVVGKAYTLTHYARTVALITARTEWRLSPRQARELARELFRFANYAEGGNDSK